MNTDLKVFTVEVAESGPNQAVGVVDAIDPRLRKNDPRRQKNDFITGGNGLARPIPFDGILTNKLLTALPGPDLARLLSYLEPVLLKAGCNVYNLGQEVEFVYFPETAIVSHVYSLADGDMTEAAVIGNEGIVGLSAILDSKPPTYWTKVTVSGTAVKVNRDIIKHEFVRSRAMQEVLLKYMNVFLSHLSHRAVCNGSHHLEERLSTWLLMIHDRANGDPLPLTHEEIADHLGARRAGITGACNNLRTSGAIDYNRGHMKILNRNALETAACECYEALRTR